MRQFTELFFFQSEASKDQRSYLRRRMPFALGIVFLVYLLAYLAMWSKAPISVEDSKGYMAMARDYSNGRLDQPSIRTPGYPLLLLALGSAESPKKILFATGLVFHFLVVCMIVTVLTSHGVPKLIVLVASVLLLLPYNVQSAALVMTENLTEFALMAAVWLLLLALQRQRVMPACAAGAAIGATALVRPTYQFLWMALAAAVWLAWYLCRSTNRCVKKASFVMVVTFLVVGVMLGGYSSYNQKRFGYFGLTYALGINLLDKTALFVERLPESYGPLRSSLIRQRDASLLQGKSHTAEQYPWDHWDKLKADMKQDDVSLAKDLARANFDLIVKSPLNYLLSVGNAAVGLLFPYVRSFASGKSPTVQALWSALHFLTLGIFLAQLCFALGLDLWAQSLRWSGCRVQVCEGGYRWRLAYLLSLATVVYTIVVSAMTDAGNPRYRSPADPLLVMNTALGISFWLHRIRAVRAAGESKSEQNPWRV